MKLQSFPVFFCFFQSPNGCEFALVHITVVKQFGNRNRLKCIKVFFRYTKSYSVTAMLTELNLFKFDSLVDKCRSDFQRQIHACGNGIVQHFVCLHLM